MLSNTSKYAIRAVIYLAIYSSPTRKIGIKKISEELGISTPFLGKILQLLVKHKLLDSAKGPHGGFSLKKPAIDISLMEIAEIMDDREAFDDCLIRTTRCNHEAPCSLHDKIAPFRKGIKSLMLTESIEDLAAEFRQGRERIKI
jgi:Rrf2 family iron-sulfur cluster assembly transcriptional regulator